MIADRVLDGLGPGYRDAAGALLQPLVEALLDPVTETARLLETSERGWATLFDLSCSRPEWLAQLVGIVPDSTLSPDEQREIIETRPAWARGTYQALVATLKSALTGSRRVRIDERDAGAWHATIRIYASDFAPGTTEEKIRALAERHRPVGMTFDVVIFPASSYGDAEANAGTYADAEANAGTYESAEE